MYLATADVPTERSASPETDASTSTLIFLVLENLFPSKSLLSFEHEHKEHAKEMTRRKVVIFASNGLKDET
jgi:hypothetical protein